MLSSSDEQPTYERYIEIERREHRNGRDWPQSVEQYALRESVSFFLLSVNV